MNWAAFFPPGSRVLALPGWRDPRLYLSAQDFLHCWRGSAFYPAVRPRARLYRSLLRTRAAVGLAEARVACPEEWLLGEFVHGVLPQVSSVVVRVSRNDPGRRATVQLWSQNKVVGYLKYAEKELVNTRLRKEHQILLHLPRWLGPVLLKYGALGAGEALLLAPITGRTLPAKLPPDERLSHFFSSLTVSAPVPVEIHPWVQAVRQQSTYDLDPWLEALARKNWPVMVQHGDAVPWNMLLQPDGTLRAVDWEHGTLEGFPFVDIVHHILQVAALIYRWDPLKAARYATEYLTYKRRLGLSATESQALVHLAAYDAYQKVSEHRESVPYVPALQAWRRAIWSEKM